MEFAQKNLFAVNVMLLALLVLAAEASDIAAPSPPPSKHSRSDKPEGTVEVTVCVAQCAAECLGVKATMVSSSPDRLYRYEPQSNLGRFLCLSKCLFVCEVRDNFPHKHCTLGCVASTQGAEGGEVKSYLDLCGKKCKENHQG